MIADPDRPYTLRELLECGDAYGNRYAAEDYQIVEWIETCGYGYSLKTVRDNTLGMPIYSIIPYTIGHEWNDSRDKWWFEVVWDTDEGATLFKLFWSHLVPDRTKR